MPLCGTNLPEPEASKRQCEELERVQVINISSDEENEDDVENILDMNGYQPLPVEIAENNDLSSEEDNVSAPESENHRDLNVDSDLVRDAMKNIKLSVSSIPLWAKEISESAWNEVVKKTIKDITTTASPLTDEAITSPVTDETTNAEGTTETI